VPLYRSLDSLDPNTELGEPQGDLGLGVHDLPDDGTDASRGIGRRATSLLNGNGRGGRESDEEERKTDEDSQGPPPTRVLSATGPGGPSEKTYS